MTEFPVPLDNLIAYVKTLHPQGEPLDRVTDAFTVSTQLDEQSDALIGYFVDQARRSGASWSQIGGAMGVSKQAAQKRFVPGRLSGIGGRGQTYSRFTPRARNVLAAAGHLVEEESVGAAELTAALLTEPEGIAAKVILRAGLTADQVYAAVGAGPATAVADTSADDLRFGHNYIGTEHLLLGTLVTGGKAADAIGALGLTAETAEQLMAAEFAALKEQRRQAG
jgi:hypothetical protein